MLTTLCINDFAIVKHLELDCSSGMTAFTGETGAGKSIMIDALMLALGGRGDASLIRPGAAQCDITVGFYFETDSDPAQWLQEHEIPCDEGELFLRRIIYPEGRSKSYINGQPFPIQKVKELSEKLVHIHGQHQHQTLLQHTSHRQQLDGYSQHHPLLEEVETLYKQCKQIQTEIDNIHRQEQQEDKAKLLQFQIEEFEALKIEAGEIEALHQEHQILHHGREYLEHTSHINSLLNGDDSLTVCTALNQILHTLNQLPQDNQSIKNVTSLIGEALIQCEEAHSEMHQFADKVQLDPERLHEVEARMSALHHLARKHHIDIHGLKEHQDTLQKELDRIQDAQSILAHLELQFSQAKKAYEQSALRLRESRIKNAKCLSEELTANIQKLGMPKGYVEVEMSPLDKMHPHGLDKVEYKVCTNPGMAPDSLSKIASGGELSRISLAIELITAQKGATPTLLFDEVDVGIGGATAALVGQMLRSLGDRLQVFCVTHQPQVAACAHNHFRVEKHSDGTQTSTTVTLLSSQEKIDEIARMLGGLKITDQTRSHAAELITQSAE